MKTTLLTTTLLFGALVANGQTNYYVSASGGSNSNNGGLSTPWLTIQHGLNQLATGDTLNVMTGTYAEKLTIPTSGITLQNYNSNTPIIDANGITSQNAIIQITNKSNILIKGLELQNSIMLDAQGIVVDGSGQNIMIKNCKVHDIHFSSNPNATVSASTNAQAILISGNTALTNVKIIGNEVYNCRLGYSEGVAVNGNVDGFEVSGNHVHDLTNIGIDLIGHEGTCSTPANDQARNGIVKNNVVHHCVSPYATSGGIYVDGAKLIVIENNISYHNGSGIEVGCENVGTSADAITVRNNIIYDNQLCGIALGGYNYPSTGKVTNSTFRNNTCYYNDYSNSGTGEISLSYSEGCVIENNIFYTSTQNILAAANLTQPSLSFNYNLFYCAAGAANLTADWNGTSYTGYSSFVTGSSTNANSNFSDPAFASATISNPNFHIPSNSPAINAGNPAFTAAPSETDMDGENRTNGTVDCGADEYYSTTAIIAQNIDTKLISIYPNPATHLLNIDLAAVANEEIAVQIVDLAGKVWMQQQVNAATNLLQISLQKIPNGIYFVRVQTAKHLITKSFVVTN